MTRGSVFGLNSQLIHLCPFIVLVFDFLAVANVFLFPKAESTLGAGHDVAF
jgi:hypothetical protein